jgi:predicted DCC family thiol-disulfide oxidoreductase YuxK
VCVLCNWAIRFIIRHDNKDVFQFSSLQSDFSKNQLSHINGQDIKKDSIIYQRGNHFYTRSEAVLEILKEIGGVWKLFYLLTLVPKPFRDWVYELIARNRYQIFGKRDQCMILPKGKDSV